MLEIVKIKNPFDRTRRETERVDFIPGQVLANYIPDKEVEFILNGNFVESPNLTIPVDGDQIIVMPHVGGGSVKRILGTIASIYLMSYVGKIAGGLWKMSTFANYLAAGAVMYVGGRIINAIFPTQQPSLGADSTSSPTYGWDTPSPITGEGGIIGVTYGECIPAPQVLLSHVETLGDQQYLNLLLCGGMGPVDEIKDIKIAGTAIGNFQNVQIETRLGTNDQSPISLFSDTPLDQAVGVEITESGVIRTTDSDTGTGLEVTIEFPNGLYHIKDDGSFGTAQVQIQVQYRKTGSLPWNPWPIMNDDAYDPSIGAATGGGSMWLTQLGILILIAKNSTLKGYNGMIAGSQNTAIRRSYRLDGLDPGKYDVQVKILHRDTGSRYCNTSTWSVLTSRTVNKYSRPNKVLVGMRILATNQLSGGIPDVTWRQIRNTVYVWNPNTGHYEARSARNPVWAAYDIYHQCRLLKNINTGQYEYTVFGVAHSRLDPYFDEWTEAAAYADEKVLNQNGGYENRFEFDAFYDTVQKRFDAAQKAANVGHCAIMPRGNNIGIKCDKPGQMVQIFGEGRTTMSSVQGTFTGTADRALAVEIVYSEQNNDFKNTQFLIRSPKWNSSPNVQDNPAQLQLFGVKRRSQAYREGVYTLANNELITQFVDLGTNVDALVCEYGDVVGYSHSVSQIGIESGRIVSASANTVQLDKTVNLQAGINYQIIFQLSDDSLVTKTVVGVAQDTETDILTINDPFTVLPQQYDNYFFGEYGRVVKPFRLVGVEKAGDLNCKLNLAEYVEGVYTGDLNYPIIDYTPHNDEIFEPSDLSLAEENYLTVDGVRTNLLHISWNTPRNARYDSFAVSYSKDGFDWKYWESTADKRSTISGVIPGSTYWVKVQTQRAPLMSAGVTSSLKITGWDAYPPDVDTLLLETLANGAKRFSWALSVDSPIDLVGYRIKYNVGKNTWWNTAIPLHSGLLTASPFVTNTLPSGTITVLIKAVDNAGNESQKAAYAVVGLGDVIVNNVLDEFDFKAAGFPGTKTSCHVDADGNLVADDSGDMMYPSDLDSPMYPADLEQPFYQTNWPAMTYEDTFNPTARGSLSFNYKIDGNVQIYYREQYPYQMYGADYNPFYPTNMDDAMYKEGPWSVYDDKVNIVDDTYQIRVEIASGTACGTIRQLKAIVDVEDESETLNDIAISASGTRLPITKSYISIKNVNLTVQKTSGSTAVNALWADKDAINGPLVYCYDATGATVSGIIDATVQGVKKV